jgi:hypothetical protein
LGRRNCLSFLKKTIDKQLKLCYNKDTKKEKEIPTMKTVWMLIDPHTTQCFHMAEASIDEFVARRAKRGQRLLKITDYKG